MGFLDIFRKKETDNRQNDIDSRQNEIDTLKNIIVEYKNTIQGDKERIIYLEEENKKLNNKIIELLENKININPVVEVKEPQKVKLTPKELIVFETLSQNQDLSNKDIAKMLNLTPGSLNVYKNKLKNKQYL